MTGSPPKKLSVVVPCFNEASNLERFPEEVFVPLSGMIPSIEMVLVDDGSSDGTFEVMTSLRTKFPDVLICRHPVNRGLGASLRTGFLASTGDAILTLDSDLTFHPREVPTLLSAYTDDVDCVMGSPFQGKMESVPPVRKFLSWSVNTLYAILLGKRFSSVSSIFRLYRANKLKALDLKCDSFDINAEVLFKLLASGAKAVEMPVTLGVRKFGVSKINTVREIKNHLKMFLKIIRWKKSSIS